MKVGFVGWRGMVGAVLLERMLQEGDFERLEPTFFSTSTPGGPGPDVGRGATVLGDAYDLHALAAHDVVVSCQGSAYTERIHGSLRDVGWSGVWIDAASALRGDPSVTLVLDPVNGEAMERAMAEGCRTFVGANCTVSLLLMGLIGLIRTGAVRWISAMTYQAASGAGARQMMELLNQMGVLGAAARTTVAQSALEVERHTTAIIHSGSFPTDAIGAPLAANALPWIDRPMPGGQTREEWKGRVEAAKLLQREDDPLPIDGLCVRIGTLRSHALALTIGLREPLALDTIEKAIGGAHPWVEVVPNRPEPTLHRLTPAAVAGTLTVAVGRIRHLELGMPCVSAFVVGDQLLWGAAEPLRRTLRMVLER